MSREELIRRINEALDSADGLEGDLALQRIFARDPAASDLADEMARIDRALRRWPEPARDADAWEALAETIEARLDDALPPIKDPASRPMLEEDEDRARDAALDGAESQEAAAEPPSRPAPLSTASGEFSLKLLTKMAGRDDEAEPSDGDRFSFTDLAPPPPRVASSAPAPFIDPTIPPPKPESRGAKGAMSWFGGALAAAAVVSLGIVIGMSLSPGRETAMQAAEPSAVAPEPEATDYEHDDGYQYDRAAEAAPAVGAVAPTELAEAETVDVEERSREEAARSRYESGAAPSSPPRSARARPAYRAPAEPEPVRQRAAGGATTTVSSGGGGAAGDTSDPTRAQRGSAATPTQEQAQGEGAASGVPAPTEERPAAEEPPPPANLPVTPDRDAVLAAMRSVQPLVEACAGERHGVATVQITVGSSGRVRSALVTGDFSGTPEGSCVARAVRRARFPQFTQPTFEITYPFSL